MVCEQDNCIFFLQTIVFDYTQKSNETKQKIVLEKNLILSSRTCDLHSTRFSLSEGIVFYELGVETIDDIHSWYRC